MDVKTGGRGRVLAIAVAAVALVGFVVAATLVADGDAARSAPDRYFRTDAGIPAEYQKLIVEASTACPENEHVTPLLIASILKAVSDSDANLSDPVTHEHGIARWTPAMLRDYLPAGERELPAPPFPPEVSIPALGEFVCRHASEPGLTGDRRGPEIGLAFGFRASVVRGQDTFGSEAGWSGEVDYVGRVEQALAAYRPETQSAD